MANCKETLDELYRYLDSELSPGRADEIVAHLKTCTDCQGAFEFHADLHRVIRVKSQGDEISPQFLDNLRGCFGSDFLGSPGE
ncbi:MAG: anti-sigma factor family protein [Actinomycetota bacterium]